MLPTMSSLLSRTGRAPIRRARFQATIALFAFGVYVCKLPVSAADPEGLNQDHE